MNSAATLTGKGSYRETAGAAAAPRRILQGIGAVVAGFLTLAGLSTAVDAALHASNIYPAVGQRMSDSLFLLATAYRIVFGILGAYITARFGACATN